MKSLVKKSVNLVSRNILSTVAVLTLMGSAVFAVAPTGGYLPGATLNPDCASGDTDCIVQNIGTEIDPLRKFVEGSGNVNAVYTGGNVGIGTTAPDQTIHLMDNHPSVKFEESDTTHEAYLELNGSKFYLRDETNSTFPFLSDLSTGNFGIGTTTPNAKLYIREENANINSWTSMADSLINSVVTIHPQSPASNHMRIGPVIAGGIGFQNSNGNGTGAYPIVFNPFGGNVGIGTPTPSVPLHIIGDALTINDMNFNLRIQDDRSMAAGIGAGVVLGGKYTTGGGQTVFGGMWTEKDNETSGHFGASLNFGSRKHSQGLETNMTINSEGNVGIGTTTPEAKLDIASNFVKLTNGTYLIHISPASGTHSLVEIKNFTTQTMAVAKAEYTQIYAWAGTGLGMGKILASTRRGNSNTIWTDINDNHIHSTQSGGTTQPTLFWDEGVLKLTTVVNNAGTYTIQVTLRSGNLEEL